MLSQYEATEGEIVSNTTSTDCLRNKELYKSSIQEHWVTYNVLLNFNNRGGGGGEGGKEVNGCGGGGGGDMVSQGGGQYWGTGYNYIM